MKYGFALSFTVTKLPYLCSLFFFHVDFNYHLESPAFIPKNSLWSISCKVGLLDHPLSHKTKLKKFDRIEIFSDNSRIKLEISSRKKITRRTTKTLNGLRHLTTDFHIIHGSKQKHEGKLENILNKLK